MPAGATVRGHLAVDLQVIEDVPENRLQDFAEFITRVGRWLQQTLPRAQP